MPHRSLTRRNFLARSLAGSAMALGAPAILRAQNTTGRLNLAFIGSGGRGGANLREMTRPDSKVDVNVVALASEFPGNLDLEVGVNELRTFLAQRDPRFDSDRHLYVRFFDLANDIKARWSKGKLTRR